MKNVFDIVNSVKSVSAKVWVAVKEASLFAWSKAKAAYEYFKN